MDGNAHPRPEPPAAPPEPTGRVLIGRDAERHAEAAQILEEAQARAASIEQRAWEAGFEAGHREATSRHTELTVRALRQVEAWARTVELRYARLVRGCVAKILDRELSVAPASVVDVVRAAARPVRWATDVVVHVHPDDARHVRARRSAIQSELGANVSLRIHEHPGIRKGGCRIETELGAVDATIDAQLDAIERAVLEAA